MRNLILFLLLGGLFFSCNNASQSDADNAEQSEETQEQEAPANKYTLTAFTPSQAYPDAKIGEMDYTGGKFSFGVSGENYKLGEQTPDAGAKMCANSAKGQHIHLIVDDKPYSAQYVAEFEHEVEDGDHFLLAFLSRSYHESIKTDDAHLAKKVSVESGAITYGEDVSSPMLFYSRPKGTYVGEADTKKVMLDFYLVNATLGEGYAVEADINGEKHRIETWQPYYIEGLEMGENTIKLTLLDEDDNPASIPLNPVTRTFTLKADPAEAN